MVGVLSHILHPSRHVPPRVTASVTTATGKTFKKHSVDIKKPEDTILVEYAQTEVDKKAKEESIVITGDVGREEEPDTDVVSPKPSRALALAKGGAKTLLKLLVEVSDVFPPLKAAAAGVQYIVERAERTGSNSAELKELEERISELLKLLPERKNDGNERKRQNALKKKLNVVRDILTPIKDENGFESFILASEDSSRIQGCIRTVERAFFEYQFSLMQESHQRQLDLIKREDMQILIAGLPRVANAGFQAYDKRSRCLENTRVDVLHALEAWADNPAAKPVFWLHGHAGSGKSTISQTFTEILFTKNILGASYFCSKERCNVGTILPTIAFQLARANHPDTESFRQELLRVLDSNPDIGSLALLNQLEHLIIGPLAKLKTDTTMVLVIDALDECEQDSDKLIELLVSNIERIPFLKLFITSRPDPAIRLTFEVELYKSVADVRALHEMDANSVGGDIERLLETELAAIAGRRPDLDLSTNPPWYELAQIVALARKAEGLFVFASTVVHFISNISYDPRDQLKTLVDNLNNSRCEGRDHLNVLYLEILQRIKSADDEVFLSRLRDVLGFLTVSHELLPISTIAEILGTKRLTDVSTTLSPLYSVLVVPHAPKSANPVRFHHRSFSEFLTDPTRCVDPRFYIDKDYHHYLATARCFDFMERKLQKNICGLSRYSMNIEIDEKERDKCITRTLRYCCRHWPDHLLSSRNREDHLRDVRPALQHFLTIRQLQWFEVLSILQELRRAVDSLNRVQEWLTSCGRQAKELRLLAVDGQKFILKTFDPVSVSAAHIYHSALPFTPEKSHLKRHHAGELEAEPQVIIGVPSHWEGPLRTLEMPHPEKAQKNTRVRAVEYSHGGTMLAVGGGSHGTGFSYLYRSGTGERLAELDCASHYIRAVTFSHDDKLVATAHKRTIILWDTCTGGRITELSLLAALKETTIISVAFHPSSELPNAGVLFCSMDDGQVFLWDIATSPTNPQRKVQFLAQDTTGVACWLSRSDQNVILIGSTLGHTGRWDISNSQKINHRDFPLPFPDIDAISAIASSKDGSLVASGSKNGSLTVYNAITEEIIHYSRKESTIRALQFSPFFKQANVLSFALGRTIHIFSPDSDSRGAVVSLDGHYRDVKCIAFSPNGRLVASGSYDNTVNIWETTRDVKDHMEISEHHSQPIRCTHFSTDGQLIISGSDDKTVRIRSATSVSRDGSAQSPSDAVFTGHSHRIREAVLLPDGKHAVSVDGHHRIIVWDRLQNKILCEHTLTTKKAKEHGGVSWIFPYTHSTLGFFSIHKRQILCWNIDLEGARLLNIAEGSVPGESVVRISPQPQGNLRPTAVAFVVECKSGKQFKTVWRDAYGAVQTPTVLTFERLKADVPRSMKARPRAYIGNEVPCRQPEDNKWILDEGGRKILWVPPAHRGAVFRYGNKLILEGGSGRLTVVDFKDVKDVQPEFF